jgi:hypothetical protein
MKWVREHGLGIVLFGLFFVFLAGQSVAGYRHYKDEQQTHQQPQVGYSQYLTSGDFIEATFENWESEFLQMAGYVLLTVFLRQKGSAESKKLSGKEAVDQRTKRSVSPNAPWPVRKGGAWLKLYEHSLSMALLALFILSFALHAYGGAQAISEENRVHGEQPITTAQYVTTSKFWYESLQNWQSEFLAVGVIVVFSVYLREKGSPESKPVNTPHYETGT